MKKFVLSLAATLLAANLAAGSLTIIEDFNNLNLGSINMQHEIIDFGFPIESWNAQANTNLRYDIGWANVIYENSAFENCLKLTNHDSDGGLDPVYASMYLGWDNRITDHGTIYLQYKTSGPNDCIIGFNDNYPGYESDIEGDPIGDEAVYQGTANYSTQSALVRLGADQNFSATHNGAYNATEPFIESGQWYEIWIQFDVPNKAARYYICQGGHNPQLVVNPSTGGEWWGWRDDTNVSIDNIKFFVSNYILIDNIAISHDYTTFSLLPYIYEPPLPYPKLPYDTNLDGIVDQDDVYDVDGDGDVDMMDFLYFSPYFGNHIGAGDVNYDNRVDISDFLLLKANYDSTANINWYKGDMDRDKDVDIDDFLILKANYGNTY